VVVQPQQRLERDDQSAKYFSWSEASAPLRGGQVEVAQLVDTDQLDVCVCGGRANLAGVLCMGKWMGPPAHLDSIKRSQPFRERQD
jgi:hypothetical protein